MPTNQNTHKQSASYFFANLWQTYELRMFRMVDCNRLTMTLEIVYNLVDDTISCIPSSIYLGGMRNRWQHHSKTTEARSQHRHNSGTDTHMHGMLSKLGFGTPNIFGFEQKKNEI